MNMSSPCFSVLLPTFNRKALCERALRSVLAQECADWEVIVVDDGSEDRTGEIVEALADERIRYCWQPNAGVTFARNKGIDLASGRYICFLDSDDEYLPHHLSTLQRQIDAAGGGEMMLFTLAYDQTDGQRRPLGDPVSTPKTPILLGQNPETSAICISTQTLRQHRFDVRLKKHEDAELWGRVAKHVPVVKVRERTVVYHHHPAPRMTARSLEHFRQMLATYEHIASTLDLRCFIPKEAMQRKWAEIYLGLLESNCDSSLRDFVRECGAMWGRAGRRAFMSRRFAKLLLRRSGICNW